MKLVISLFLLAMLIDTANAFLGRPVDLGNKQNQVNHVRVLDVATHIGLLPELKDVAEELEKNLDKYTQDLYEFEFVYNVFFRSIPQKGDGYYLPVTAMVKTKEGRYLFLDLDIVYQNKKEITGSVVRTISLDDSHFRVDVSLKERKVVIKDQINEIKMVMPLGVGSFDESVLNDGVTILTPRFEHAFLDKRAAIEKRKKPRYFAKKPFIRITTSEDVSKGRTSIGFHAQPNLDPFIRAFDSHGCMRMQTNDLEMLYWLVSKGPTTRIPVTVNFTMMDQSEHPFPKRDRPYKTVSNIGSKTEPMYTIDRDGLVQVRSERKNNAPIEKLINRAGDNYHEMFDYAMDWREKEWRERVMKKCMADYGYEAKDFTVDRSKYVVKWEDYKPTTSFFDTEKDARRKLRKAEKEFEKAQKEMAKELKRALKDAAEAEKENKMSERRARKKCLKATVRNGSLADRIYRWWVH